MLFAIGIIPDDVQIKMKEIYAIDTMQEISIYGTYSKVPLLMHTHSPNLRVDSFKSI